MRVWDWIRGLFPKRETEPRARDEPGDTRMTTRTRGV